MADNLTAASRASGFGATEQKNDNSEQIADLLDQVRDLLIEDGQDAATAEALTNFARPTSPAIAGNLADLMRMGQIAVTGKVDTPVGEADIEASSLEEAFAEPPAPDLNTGLQTPLGQIDAEGRPTGGTVGETTDTAADTGDGGLEDMTKSELLDEAERRGVDVSSSSTKAEIIAAIEAG